jgi:hypothetical protein
LSLPPRQVLQATLKPLSLICRISIRKYRNHHHYCRHHLLAVYVSQEHYEYSTVSVGTSALFNVKTRRQCSHMKAAFNNPIDNHTRYTRTGLYTSLCHVVRTRNMYEQDSDTGSIQEKLTQQWQRRLRVSSPSYINSAPQRMP